MAREKTLIPNKQIELMFFRIATDEEVQKYVDLAEGGLRHTASAYASNKVYHTFMDLVDLAEAIGALPLTPVEPAPEPLIIGSPVKELHRDRVRRGLRILPGGAPLRAKSQ